VARAPIAGDLLRLCPDVLGHVPQRGLLVVSELAASHADSALVVGIIMSMNARSNGPAESSIGMSPSMPMSLDDTPMWPPATPMCPATITASSGAASTALSTRQRLVVDVHEE